jgi:hypothetical protein
MMIRINGKKALEMSFAWMFAIIAGAVILFIAIYASVQFIDVAKEAQYAKQAFGIDLLTDPLQSGIADATGGVISFDRETRVFWNCYLPTTVDAFGRNSVSFSEESGFGEKWKEPSVEIFIRNKFIFADAIEQGQEMYVFSKPFNLGFRVADLTFASSGSEEYCFVNPPSFVEDDILSLGVLKNLNVSDSLNSCGEEKISVCFGTLGCDISVIGEDGGFDKGYVEKDGSKMYYSGNLVYGAIFGKPEIYECNVVRLGTKAAELADVYYDKIGLVSIKGCSSRLEPYLNVLSAAGREIKSSQDILIIHDIANEMHESEKEALCKIYS